MAYPEITLFPCLNVPKFDVATGPNNFETTETQSDYGPYSC